MREIILFRGKDVKGIWHTGLVSHIKDSWYISNLVGMPATYEVIPETIGQYTGLTDKNGIKIFEEDIIKHYNSCPIKEYSEDIGVVFWHQPTLRYLKTSSIFPDDCSELFNSNEYEIVGNVYDNCDPQ